MFRSTSEVSPQEREDILFRQLSSFDVEQVASTLLELGRSSVNLERVVAACLSFLSDEDRCVRQCAVNTLTSVARRGAPLDIRATIHTLQRMATHEDDLNGSIPDSLVVLQGMLLNRERWIQPLTDDYA